MAVEMGAEQIAEKCEQFARSLVPSSTLGLPAISPAPPSLHSNPPVASQPLPQQPNASTTAGLSSSAP
jgi:hypothetical protein